MVYIVFFSGVNAIEDAIRAVTLSYKDKLPSTESLALTLRFSEGGLNNDRSSIHLRGTFSPSSMTLCIIMLFTRAKRIPLIDTCTLMPEQSKNL